MLVFQSSAFKEYARLAMASGKSLKLWHFAHCASFLTWLSDGASNCPFSLFVVEHYVPLFSSKSNVFLSLFSETRVWRSAVRNAQVAVMDTYVGKAKAALLVNATGPNQVQFNQPKSSSIMSNQFSSINHLLK